MNQEDIKEYVKESPYQITIKEWNHIKKRIRAKAPEGSRFSFRKEGKWLDVDVNLPLEYLNITSTILRALDRGDHRWPTPLASDEGRDLKKAFQAIVDEHDVCYDKSDLMTDYYGVYRLKCVVQIGFDEEVSQTMGQIIKELMEVNEKKGYGRSLYHHEYNKIAQKYDFPLLQE